MRPYSPQKLLPEYQAYLAWVRTLAPAVAARQGMPVSRWYRARGLELYTRCGPSVFKGTARRTLCLANIELEERRQGRGFFTHLVTFLKAEAPALGFEVLKVEAVQNEKLLAWLLRQGFCFDGVGDEGRGGSVVLELPAPTVS